MEVIYCDTTLCALCIVQVKDFGILKMNLGTVKYWSLEWCIIGISIIVERSKELFIKHLKCRGGSRLGRFSKEFVFSVRLVVLVYCLYASIISVYLISS